jgi:hypothetical protein
MRVSCGPLTGFDVTAAGPELKEDESVCVQLGTWKTGGYLMAKLPRESDYKSDRKP